MADIKIETRDSVYEPAQYPVRIGRAVDNDVVIRALGVADYHAILEQTPEGLQVRSLHDTQINGKTVRSRAAVSKNSFLTLGSAKVKIWLNPKGSMPNPARRLKWQYLTHPAAAILWFFAALALPMWHDYLATSIRYVLNWKYLFLNAVLILTLVWIVHSMILPIMRRYLLVPLLGIVSAVSVISEILDSITGRLSFQISWPWLDVISLLISSALFILLIRAFMRDFIPMGGRLLTRYALAISLPCVLLLLYNYLQAHDFYSKRPGSYPSYSQTLYQNPLIGAGWQDIDSFLKIEKTNQ